MNVDEIKFAISQLPPGELGAFARWFEKYLADAQNCRIEAASTSTLGDELRGSVLRYDDPTAPVAESDWDTSQRHS